MGGVLRGVGGSKQRISFDCTLLQMALSPPSLMPPAHPLGMLYSDTFAHLGEFIAEVPDESVPRSLRRKPPQNSGRGLSLGRLAR